MNEPKAATTPRAEFWCNFCGFTVADETLYLAHSCTDELRLRGKLPDADSREKHCR